MDIGAPSEMPVTRSQTDIIPFRSSVIHFGVENSIEGDGGELFMSSAIYEATSKRERERKKSRGK